MNQTTVQTVNLHINDQGNFLWNRQGHLSTDQCECGVPGSDRAATQRLQQLVKDSAGCLQTETYKQQKVNAPPRAKQVLKKWLRPDIVWVRALVKVSELARFPSGYQS